MDTCMHTCMHTWYKNYETFTYCTHGWEQMVPSLSAPPQSKVVETIWLHCQLVYNLSPHLTACVPGPVRLHCCSVIPDHDWFKTKKGWWHKSRCNHLGLALMSPTVIYYLIKMLLLCQRDPAGLYMLKQINCSDSGQRQQGGPVNQSFTDSLRVWTYCTCAQTHTDSKGPGRRPSIHDPSFFKWGCHLGLSTQGRQPGRGGGSALMCVTGNRQAYWLSITQPLYFLSPLRLSPCGFLRFSPSLFFFFFSLSPSLPQVWQAKDFHLLQRGKINESKV